jgi:hypothetical protein
MCCCHPGGPRRLRVPSAASAAVPKIAVAAILPRPPRLSASPRWPEPTRNLSAPSPAAAFGALHAGCAPISSFRLGFTRWIWTCRSRSTTAAAGEPKGCTGPSYMLRCARFTAPQHHLLRSQTAAAAAGRPDQNHQRAPVRLLGLLRAGGDAAAAAVPAAAEFAPSAGRAV